MCASAKSTIFGKILNKRVTKAPIGYHLLALAVTAVWGTTFVSTKVLIVAGMHPAAIFAIRFLLSYVGICLFSILRKDDIRWFSRSWKDELVCLFLGISGGSIYFLVENSALIYTQAANVSFFVCTAPLFTALLTLIGRQVMRGRFRDGLEDVHLGRALIVGTLLALIGIALVVFDGERLQWSLRGDILAITAAILWALYSLFAGEMTKEYNALFISRKVFFYGLITVLPFLGGTASSFSPALLSQPVIYLNLLFLGLVASLIAFFSWHVVMARIGNVTSTNYIYLNPIFTLIVASLILSEQLSAQSLFGSLAILSGVILAGRSQKQ